MKKLILLAAIVCGFITLAPAARAFEDDPWHAVDKRIKKDLYPHMAEIDARAHKFGVGPRMHDQIEHLRFGIQQLAAVAHDRDGSPKAALARGEDLEQFAQKIDGEFSDRRHVWVEVR
jgi:hypothetical protein